MPVTINIYNHNNQNTTKNAFLEVKDNIINNNIGVSRQNNCNTPFRMPLIGTRKENKCKGCEPNTKVLKDNHALYCCYDPYISNKQNKGGIRKNDFLYSNQQYLYNRNKLYNKNTKSHFINTRTISGSPHTYQASLSDPSNNNIVPCHLATYKKRNYNHDTFGAVSHKNRIARLKYNAVKARKLTPRVSCDNYNSNCYDDDLPRHIVDISKPPYCHKQTIYNKVNHTNKKISCNSGYTGPEEKEKPSVTYIFPQFMPKRQPPPDNGLASDYYHNQYFNSLLNFNFNYQPLEFNTNYQNRNSSFIPGPVPTVDTTDTSPDEIYNFNVTPDTITYTTQTPEVTTVVQTDVNTGVTNKDIFLTNSVREDEIEILDGAPSINISEVKIMNKTIRITVNYNNISHWHYHLGDSNHYMVYSSNTVIFNVPEYGTYTLNVHGVDTKHNKLASAPSRILEIVQPVPRYITSGTVEPFVGDTTTTTNTTTTNTTTNDTTTYNTATSTTTNEESSNTSTTQSVENNTGTNTNTPSSSSSNTSGYYY